MNFNIFKYTFLLFFLTAFLCRSTVYAEDISIKDKGISVTFEDTDDNTCSIKLKSSTLNIKRIFKGDLPPRIVVAIRSPKFDKNHVIVSNLRFISKIRTSNHRRLSRLVLEMRDPVVPDFTHSEKNGVLTLILKENKGTAEITAEATPSDTPQTTPSISADIVEENTSVTEKHTATLEATAEPEVTRTPSETKDYPTATPGAEQTATLEATQSEPATTVSATQKETPSISVTPSPTSTPQIKESTTPTELKTATPIASPSPTDTTTEISTPTPIPSTKPVTDNLKDINKAVLKKINFVFNSQKQPQVSFKIKNRDRFSFTQKGSDRFILSVPDCSLADDFLALPFFASQDFVPFISVLAQQDKNSLNIEIKVDSGSKLTAIPSGDEIIIRAPLNN